MNWFNCIQKKWHRSSLNLVKLVSEYEKLRDNKWVMRNPSPDSDFPNNYVTPTLDAWLRLALSDPEKIVYLPSRHLREIRELFIKTMRHEPDPVDEIVDELIKQAQVAGVMIA